MKYWLAAFLLYVVPAIAVVKHEDGSVTFSAEEMAIIIELNSGLKQAADALAYRNKELEKENAQLRTRRCI